MKLGKKIAWALLIVFVGMQFFQPDKNEDTSDHLATFLSETNPPDQVEHLLKTSCFDCHSNHTVYPWYNRVAPVSYWLADHIDHGKGHLNFSEWGTYDAGEKDHKLEEVVETVESGEMPLREYTWTHAEARLTESQRNAILEWARLNRSRLAVNGSPE
ncbi:heme-binding domain-containing protein [Robiginitalea biformata]|uniref:heme-binding domain-containing protein n=1 Tax=Robiginitalea biformata TaxID=252307 RepID=UPI003B5995ED